MARGLLSEEQFSRVVVTRARRERPDLRVKAMGKFFLMVDHGAGKQRVLSLVSPYQAYGDSPSERDEVIGTFLSTVVYQDPTPVRGTFEENYGRIMPQVVPPNLLQFCRIEGRELAAVEYVGDLAIAFVIDEPERYSYIQQSVAHRWDVGDRQLLTAAMQNLTAMNHNAPRFDRFGTGHRLALVWETFDGYDASRVLLTRDLSEMAALVCGTPVIAIPHRDYFVMFGDEDEDFLAEMTNKIATHFEGHSYPITTKLFTLVGGSLEVYEGPGSRHRILN